MRRAFGPTGAGPASAGVEDVGPGGSAAASPGGGAVTGGDEGEFAGAVPAAFAPDDAAPRSIPVVPAAGLSFGAAAAFAGGDSTDLRLYSQTPPALAGTSTSTATAARLARVEDQTRAAISGDWLPASAVVDS